MHMDHQARNEPAFLEAYERAELNLIGRICRLNVCELEEFKTNLGIEYKNGLWYVGGVLLHLSSIEWEPEDCETGIDPASQLRAERSYCYDMPQKEDIEPLYCEILKTLEKVEAFKDLAMVETSDTSSQPMIELAPAVPIAGASTSTHATMIEKTQPQIQANPSKNINTNNNSMLIDKTRTETNVSTPDPTIAKRKTEASQVEASDSSLEFDMGSTVENDDDYQQQQQHQPQPEEQNQQPESSPSHSSVSAKTNNDNEDNNNNPEGDAQDGGATPSDGLGRNRRVRQKNRYFEDFHCMNLKKGARSKDDYDVFSPSVSAPTRSSNRRSTTDSRRDLLASAGAGGTDGADPTEYFYKNCSRCHRRTPHDPDRNCQACLYRKIVSTSKRQKTLRLKAQENRSDGGAVATGADSCKLESNNNEGDQSLATSASSSVAHTPTSLDGNGPSNSSSRNKRKSRSQGGRSSKQPAILPTVHDTEEMDSVNEPNHATPTLDVISPITNSHNSHTVVQLDGTRRSAQDHHNTSGSSGVSDATTDINNTASTINSGGSSGTSSSSGISANSINKQTASQASLSPSTTLKLTTSLRPDEKGKKRWVVIMKPSGSVANDENVIEPPRDIAHEESKIAKNDEPIRSRVTENKIFDQNTGANNVESRSNSDETVNNKKTTSDTNNKSVAPMNSSKGIANNNITNSSQMNGDDGQNQPPLIQLDAWTPDQVAQYVSSRGFSQESELFKSQAVDGITLLLMKRTDFTYGLKMKLGPALKLFDQVCKLKREYFSLSATAS